MSTDLIVKLTLPRRELDKIDTTDHVVVMWSRVARIKERYTGRTRYYWLRRRPDGNLGVLLWPRS